MPKNRATDTTDMSVWTPITPRGGGLVHATSLTNPHRTICNKIAAGWKVAIGGLTCGKCEAIVHYDVTPRRKSKRKRGNW